MAEQKDLPTEDAKLVTLARATSARLGCDEAAAVRDDAGRTYVAGPVKLAALQLSSLQAVVAVAAASGAERLEAAVLLGPESPDGAGIAAVGELLVPGGAVLLADRSGALISRLS